MPSIRDAVHADLSGYSPANPVAKTTAPVTQSTMRASPILRCPLPPFGADVDSLRQFEQGAGIPQIRIIPPPLVMPSTSTGAASGQLASSSSSSSSSSTTVSLTAATVVVNVGTLAPSGVFIGTASILKKSFQLLYMSSTSAVDVRLYGTSTAQLLDSTRLIDDPVPAEVGENIISDVLFDTAPFTWGWQNRIAANQASPQVATIYVTVVNPSTTDTLIGVAVSITYLPLES